MDDALLTLATDLAGDLSPAERRVLADEAADLHFGDPLAALTAIVADHRDVDYEDVEDEVADAFSYL